MRQKLKNEKGVITLYVTITCMFIIITGISAYVLSSNKQQAQLAQLSQIEASYETGITEDDLYKQYVGGEIIRIFTEEQFLKIASNEDVYIDAKVYSMTANKTYVLQQNWESNSNYSTIVAKVQNANGVIIKDYE